MVCGFPMSGDRGISFRCLSPRTVRTAPSRAASVVTLNCRVLSLATPARPALCCPISRLTNSSSSGFSDMYTSRSSTSPSTPSWASILLFCSSSRPSAITRSSSLSALESRDSTGLRSGRARRLSVNRSSVLRSRFPPLTDSRSPL